MADNVVSYEVRVTDPYGRVIIIIDEFTSLDYARKVNDVGELSLVVQDKYDRFVFVPENRIEVWRIKNDIGKLDMDATWFIYSVVRKTEGGINYIEVFAQDQICLLKRRVIPYNEGNPTTQKQDSGDDVIKAIMRENFGSLASDTDRDLSNYLSIQSDVGLAPQATVFCAKENVYDTIKDIAEACYEDGTFLAFDLAYIPYSGTFEFRTYVHQRGLDRSVLTGNGTAIVGLEFGSLSQIAFYDNREDEANFIYCGKNMVVDIYSQKEASDTQSIGLSPFNRKELFVSASSADDEDELQTEANANLEANRAKKRVEAKLTQEYILTQYGDTFGYGDRVTVSFDGQMYTMMVDAVSVTINNQGEEIDVVMIGVNE